MRPIPTGAARLLPLAALVFAACQPSSDRSGPPRSPPPAGSSGGDILQLRMAIQPLGGSGVSGHVLFESPRDEPGRYEPVTLYYVFDGLTPGDHGFHIHETASCEPDSTGEPGSAAGGHANPDSNPHGARGAAAAGRHAGDLGNITADAAGHAEGTVVDSVLTPVVYFYGSVIVHAGADDLATQPSGNAGGRVACGVPEPRRSSDGHH